MDDFVILARTRRGLRAAGKQIYQVLNELKQKVHASDVSERQSGGLTSWVITSIRAEDSDPPRRALTD